jgi:hypothetical protein
MSFIVLQITANFFKGSVMRILLGIILVALTGTSIAGKVLYQSKLETAKDISGFSVDKNITIKDNALTGDFPERVSFRAIELRLPSELYSGRLLRLSCEAKGDNILQSKKSSDGIKVMLSMVNAKRKAWGGITFPHASFDWQNFETTVAVPENLKSIKLFLGIQNSAGEFQLRNLKIESIGIPVQIRNVANMGLRDEVAGDFKGGWTDQGPQKDGRCFYGYLFKKNFAGIPIDAEPEGQGILTMYSKYFTAGLNDVTIPVQPAEAAKSLYLMHTLAWGPAMKNKLAGYIALKDKHGHIQEIPVSRDVDVADWYRQVTNLPNGYGVLRGKTGDGNIAGIYLSRFDIDPKLGEITEVKFSACPEGLWIILGATLSQEELSLPESHNFKIDANANWLPVSRPDKNRILPGSAIDLSSYMRKETVDELGRVIIKNGHFVFEENPTQRIRFLTNALTPYIDLKKLSHDELEELATEMRRNGYNMVRTHFLDQSLMTGATDALEFNADMLDSIDYFIYCMKKNGIYWNFDCVTSWIGYTPGNPRKMQDQTKSFKSRIYFDQEVRENWRRGVEKFLCRVNPYTRTRLIDDPVLVMAVAFNEQEFGLWREFDQTWFLPQWRAFLKNKYDSIEQLHKSWGKDSAKFKDFNEIPCLKGYSRNYSDVDAAEFLLPLENELFQWYQAQMKEMGFKGYLTAYNCGKTQFFNYLRKDCPVVAMNHYHAHPSNWVSKFSFISQNSAISQAAQVFRNFMGTRLTGKPFVITEQNFTFWNRYRYEQGFVIGGYAAFQDFDALTCHGSPISFRNVNDIQSFAIWTDPIAKASELLTYFLFIREDVTSAKPTVRIRADKADSFTKNAVSGALSAEQSLPSLMVGLSIECTDNDKDQVALCSGEIAYRLGSTDSVVVNNAGYSGSEDNPVANIEEILLHLKKSGALPPQNRSDGRNVFESASGQLLLDKSENYMRINTPRLQGVCANAGTVDSMPDFSIQKMTADGNLALVAIDGLKNIFEAERLLLVYATNALNSGMEFSSADMITLLNNGHAPTLIKSGSFSIVIRNKNAANLIMYPLDLAGKRLKEIHPEKVTENQAYFSVDTQKDGASLYFEVIANL